MAHSPACLICTCGDSQPLDHQALGRALGQEVSAPVPLLCRNNISRFQQAIESTDDVLVACEQEAATFEAYAEANGFAGTLNFVDIRDQAGWSNEADAAAPKMAALIAAAKEALSPPPAIAIQSGGTCVIYGDGPNAMDAAHHLAGRLDVVVLMVGGETEIIPPPRRNFAIMCGRVARLEGGLGNFQVTIDQAAALKPDVRAELQYEISDPSLAADIFVDLAGGAPLVASPSRHDGYLRADPNDPAAIMRALLAASDLVGEFDKPRYITFTADLCAHSRSKRTGCTRCLDACPAGAIQPAGDYVSIDAVICAGCGHCSSLCPTGAATYQAPRPEDLGRKLRTMLRTYRIAGGDRAHLMVLDDRHGRPLVAAAARYGNGLPANVLPLTLENIGPFGLEAMLAAIAYGAERVLLLAGAQRDRDLIPLETNILYGNEILTALGYGAGRIQLILEDDPDELRVHIDQLLSARVERIDADYLAVGGKRDQLRLGLEAVHRAAPEPVDMIAMPPGAPFGNLSIDAGGCTLCLACVGVCPTGALIDNPDQPMLRFIEDACVQCGLCRNTCPEEVIRLEARINFDPAAKSPRLIKQEQPFECIRCGKPFGTQSSVNRIVEKLASSHWMFQDPEQIDRIKMCEDCRVKAQFERQDNPLRMGEKPRIKTTDDYLREREELEATRQNLKPRRDG